MNLNTKAYSGRTGGVIYEVFRFAAKMRHGFAGSEHVLWAIAHEGQGRAAEVLGRFGVGADLIEEAIRRYDRDAAESGGVQAIQMSREMQRILEVAEDIRKEQEDESVEPEHLLLAILRQSGCAAFQLLHSLGVDAGTLREALSQAMRQPLPEDIREESGQEEGEPLLEKYSRDLTSEADAGLLDPMIGRDKVVERVIQILSRRTKNNPALIGEPGVGKTAVAEGLAQRMAAGHVPQNLQGKRILSLDLAGMLAGTRFRGDFEERIKGFLEEIKKDGQIILFIDEFHTLIGAGSGSNDAMDAANILKQSLGRGELQVIGATTLREYRQYIEKDAAMERRFQPVMIEEPDREDAVKILMGLREKYEEFHELTITDEAIRAAVELSDRYISDRYLPDKAIDLMDEAASRIRVRSMTVPAHLQALDEEVRKVCEAKKKAAAAQEYEQAAVLRDKQKALSQELKEKQEQWRNGQNAAVTAEDVAEVVSAWTNIPVTMLTQDERQRLRKLEETLHKRVIGQEPAISAVSRAIRRARTGVAQPGRPIGSFLFLGPTGVGKTEVSRALAEVMFQDENAVLRFDMSEYMEPHAVSKLIGSPPGYVGYEEGGQLTEQVRRKPYSILLFDEIEKAHPDVWNTLLQVMDDGRLTDSQGRTVSFKNTIIILTSNIGAKNIVGRNSLGFVAAEEKSEEHRAREMESRVMDEVKRAFQPEFLNRLDEIIVFRQLDKENIREIARNLADRFAERMAAQGVNLEVDETAIDLLAEQGFDPVYGARPLRRAIQSTLENAVADRILEGGFDSGDKLIATAQNGKMELRICKNPQKILSPVTI
ncbi:ATP-dependent Clp protease ATP-binding subunit [Zhenpiania hominis]|uniref:ATP-dependent Clp protease ATP-binding subunit n=1 Tax=Zhenpiania hominis TaxID=2763644 RepID=A0A923SQM7_9FIRM|nr:ATP-dependent Clp protease ATP-binding subunit [Zhenpiania hominis]MBC6679766.1 ATP-dependent Clp protease ATP-binding subunit [Zhenpiania hominis]